jgi:hypothetical protein
MADAIDGVRLLQATLPLPLHVVAKAANLV